MQLNIKGKEYDLNFGIGFLRELDKRYFIERNNMKFGASMDFKIPLLLAGDTVTLSDIIYAGTHAYKSRPSQPDVDAYIDEVEDIDKLLEEVVDELKKSNATKVQVIRIHRAMEANGEKETKSK